MCENVDLLKACFKIVMTIEDAENRRECHICHTAVSSGYSAKR